MKYLKYYLLALGIIVLDQVVKLAVYHYMPMGSAGEIKILGDLFKLHYVENPGMAFGVELGFTYGKLFLTLFRVFAGFGIAYYIYYLVKKKTSSSLIWCVAMILGGAIGNVLDSIFYGVYLGNAPFNAPSPWFHGKVIDMFYIDIWQGRLPEWLPLWGGDYMAFWPIFNVADASIFIAISVIVIFQKKFFKETAEIHHDSEKDNILT